MNVKGLFGGIVLIILIGIAGFLYRSIKEQSPVRPIACQPESKTCPDGTELEKDIVACVFAACPPPNVELADAHIAFALPPGYAPTPLPDEDAIAAYVKEDSGIESYIFIRKYTLAPDVTAANFIRENAIMDGSGLPASPAAFSSVTLGSVQSGHRQFSMVNLGRFEGVVLTTYYLSHEGSVFRFDAQSRNVADWTDPALDISKLPANQDLRSLLQTLQGSSLL